MNISRRKYVERNAAPIYKSILEYACDLVKGITEKITMTFNAICINEELLSKCTYVKYHVLAAHQYISNLDVICKNNSYNNTVIQRIQKKMCTEKMSLTYLYYRRNSAKMYIL